MTYEKLGEQAPVLNSMSRCVTIVKDILLTWVFGMYMTFKHVTVCELFLLTTSCTTEFVQSRRCATHYQRSDPGYCPPSEPPTVPGEHMEEQPLGRAIPVYNDGPTQVVDPRPGSRVNHPQPVFTLHNELYEPDVLINGQPAHITEVGADLYEASLDEEHTPGDDVVEISLDQGTPVHGGCWRVDTCWGIIHARLAE